VDLPNVNLFKEHIGVLKVFLMTSAADAAAAREQAKDIDFLLILGELFTLVAYGQAIIDRIWGEVYSLRDAYTMND
jgi:acyl-CoA dehydrogenase